MAAHFSPSPVGEGRGEGGHPTYYLLMPLFQRDFLSITHVHHDGKGSKDLRLRARVDRPDPNPARGGAAAFDFTEQLDDISAADRRLELELAEQSRNKFRGGKTQRRRVVGHVIGPKHHVTAEQRSEMIQELGPDQQCHLVTHGKNCRSATVVFRMLSKGTEPALSSHG